MAQLIYLMGPSGSGKDSLLTALRQQASAHLLVAHRYITRPATLGCENYIALTEHEFAQRKTQGLFALTWQAHQCCYGLGIEIDLWLQKGLDVVINGSRAYLPQAQRRYGKQLLPLCLQVSPEILAQRLQQRGRENSDQIAQRLVRAGTYQNNLPADCQILNNDNELDQTLSALSALLPGRASSPSIQGSA